MYSAEIKVKPSGSYQEGNTYAHESFGMCRIAHIHGTGMCFGSEVESTSMVEITISGCEVTQDLGQNWYNPRDVKVKVRLSAVQYAELISNPNGQGSPCTIMNTEKLGSIEQRYIETQMQHVESVMDSTMKDVQAKVGTLQADVEAVLSRKGAFSEADKDELRKLMGDSVRKLGDHLPFYQKCMKENVDRMKADARADINCHIQHSINETGLAVLKNPELVERLIASNIEDKKIESN